MTERTRVSLFITVRTNSRYSGIVLTSNTGGVGYDAKDKATRIMKTEMQREHHFASDTDHGL